jgi:hypothetical protein
MLLGLLGPDPDPLVRGAAPDLDPSILKHEKKNLDSYCFFLLFMIFYL